MVFVISYICTYDIVVIIGVLVNKWYLLTWNPKDDDF